MIPGLPAHERRNRIGKTAIALEAALGVVLVLAAAMVVRNFITLLKTDPGFAPTHLHVLRVQPPGSVGAATTQRNLRVIAASLIASYWISTWVQTLVYDVHARDPWTFTVVAVTLIGTAAAGSWLPARRASRIDPADVLREQ